MDVQYDPSVRPSRPISQIFEKWLGHSASAPLRIRLRLTRTGNDLEYDKLLALAFAETYCWRDVDIDLNRVSPGRGDPLMVRCVPSLASLRLSFEGLQFTAPPNPKAFLNLTACTDAGRVTQLQHLDVFTDVTWIFPSPREALHLPNLNYLSFSTDLGTSLSDTFFVLSACPSISELQVTIRSTPYLNISGPGSVLLPNLKHLKMTSRNTIRTHHLLCGLSCPSLQTFSFRVSPSTEEAEEERESIVTMQHLRSLTTFLRSCSTPRLALTELSLKFHPKRDAIPSESQFEYIQALEQLLGLVDGLRGLYLSGLVIDDELVQKLTLRTEEVEKSVLCPSLEYLQIRCGEDFGIQKQSVEDMIASRWTSGDGGGLREVALAIPGFASFEKESEEMKKCVGEGLVFGDFHSPHFMRTR